jgi:hypothetical protein
VAKISIGTELVRPFMPAKDFDVSKRFYEALGFEKVLDGEVAIFRVGSSGFILQRYFQEDWAGNFMMQLMVDDLDAWWAHIESLDLATTFAFPAPRAPAMQPGDFASRTSSIRLASSGTLRSDGKMQAKIDDIEDPTNCCTRRTKTHAREQ